VEVARIPADEIARLAVLRDLGILDTPTEERFERITRLAQRVFDVPIVLLSLVDADRQWFKSCIGLPDREMGRHESFCAHTILSDRPLIVEDAHLDGRFVDNPLVVNAPHIRFYAGQPLAGRGGHRLGTLCLIDRRPRTLNADDVTVLRDLADWAESELNSVELAHALSERKRAHDALAVQTERVSQQAALLDLAPSAILVRDLYTSTISFWNEGAEELYGWSRNEAIGRNSHDLLNVQFGEPTEVIGARLIATGRWEGEIEHTRRDGGRVVVASRWALLRGPGDEPRAILEINTDITPRKQAEVEVATALAAQRAANERLAETLAGRDALLSLARRLSVEDSSAQVLVAALTTAVNLLGGDDASLARWDDTRRVLVQAASLSSNDQNGTVLDLEYSAIGQAVQAHRPIVRNFGPWEPAGQTPSDAQGAVVAVPLLHEGQVLGTLCVTTRDSGRRFTETDAETLELLAGIVAAALATSEAFERQRQAVQQLKDLNQAKSDFVSIVSHEFRTPLTGIQGFSEAIRDEALEPDEVRELAGDINVEARRLGRMIGEMLDLDRMESGKMMLHRAPVQLNLIITEVAERLRSGAPHHTLTLRLDPNLPTLLGDRDKLTQVMLNLLNNAIKYAPDGGQVIVSSAADAKMVHVQVQDQGVGVTPDTLESIFEHYTRVESERSQSIQGTGLGLPIVRQIAELHGGRAWAEVAPDRGSIFHVTLPIRPAEEGEPA
jgi:PAS domain S-box-containing protein